MCGIIAGVNGNDMAQSLVDGLRRLEYRSYDSAGLAVMGTEMAVRKATGPVDALALLLREHPAAGSMGIAHTRWATHGKPTRGNAHPHVFDRVAVVHNGIIENHAELRAELAGEGDGFLSETDSEVIPHLIARNLRRGMVFAEACRAAADRMTGRFAFVAMVRNMPALVAVQRGCALVLGKGPGCAWVASDDIALSGRVEETVSLEDGEMAVLTRAQVDIFDGAMEDVDRGWTKAVETEADIDGIGTYPTHTRREIDQQPAAIRRTLMALANRDLPEEAVAAKRILIAACGSSYYAGLLARPWFERLAGIKVDVEIASEIPSRPLLDTDGTVGLLISQSGETADTLAALEAMKAAGMATVGVVNVAKSKLARDVDILWPTDAGREIGVAATKTFTTQALALMALAHRLATLKGTIDLPLEENLRAEMARFADMVPEVLALEEDIAGIARFVAGRPNALFLGRGADFAAAAEGALKFKELTYLHAEAYAAGELKHGPIAVIEDGLPVIACAGSGAALEKTLSNLAEVQARGAVTILIGETGHVDTDSADFVVAVPAASPFLGPLVRVIALQLLAYHAAVALDRNVDRPRNLAKSVTVE
jgi:glucosamine--fructose-6-phosphate aminotransferase (isomerizing)